MPLAAIIAFVVVLVAVVVVIIGVRMPQSQDPIQERLSELMVSEEAMTLEELSSHRTSLNGSLSRSSIGSVRLRSVLPPRLLWSRRRSA